MGRAVKLLLILLIPFTLQAKVFTIDEWVSFYTRPCKPGYSACKQSLESDLGKMLAYSDLVFKHLDKQGLPRWIATIPIVESSYNEKAISRAGALGMWQIMPYNIERYKTRKVKILGRKITIVPSDEKVKKYGFNPVTSTKIATFILRNLYEKYKHHKDYEMLVVMAYNAGERRVNLWLKGTGKLPDETKNYYNKIMSIQRILNNLREYDIKPKKHRKILIFEHIKELVSMESREKSDHVREIIKRVLG